MRGPKNHDRHRKEATNAIQVNGRTRKRRKNRRSKHIEVGYLHIGKQQTGIKKALALHSQREQAPKLSHTAVINREFY